MKKILALFLFCFTSLFFGLHFLFAESNTQAVVCPVYKLPVPKEGCTYIYKKNSNGCEIPTLTCKIVEPLFCPEVMPAEPKKGCSITIETGSNGCKYPKQICTDTCPQYNLPPEKEWCTITWEKNELWCKKPVQTCKKDPTTTCPVYNNYPIARDGCKIVSETWNDGCTYPKQVCPSTDICPLEVPAPEGCYYKYDTKENIPQCLQIKTLVCDKKPSCPVYKLAAPKEWCKYTYEINWSGCEVPKLVCEDIPVTKCKDYSNVKISSTLNGCPLVWYTDENQCKTFKYECTKETPNTDKIKEKLNQALEALFKKLDASSLSSDEKIAKLKTMSARLQEYLSKKPALKDLLSFVIEKVNTKISLLQQENDDGIDDILNILDL